MPVGQFGNITRQVVDTYQVYRFLRILSTRWVNQDAYKYGIIDGDGNILRKRSTLKTPEEKASYTLLHRLVWKIKRLIEKIPLGRTRIATIATALWFLKEEYDAESLRNVEIGVLQYMNTHYPYAFSMPSKKANGKTLLTESRKRLSTSANYRLAYPVQTLNDNVIVKTGTLVRLLSTVPVMTCFGVPLFEAVTANGYKNKFPVALEQLLSEDGEAIAPAGEGVPANNAGSGNIAGIAPDSTVAILHRDRHGRKRFKRILRRSLPKPV